MAKILPLPGYDTNIEIGTQADDARLGPNSLYLIMGQDRREIRVLAPQQALQLAAVLLETLSELPNLR